MERFVSHCLLTSVALKKPFFYFPPRQVMYNISRTCRSRTKQQQKTHFLLQRNNFFLIDYISPRSSFFNNHFRDETQIFTAFAQLLTCTCINHNQTMHVYHTLCGDINASAPQLLKSDGSLKRLHREAHYSKDLTR